MATTNIRALLAAEFEAIKADVITRYQESGLSVSGNWATTLEVTATETSASLLGAGYLEGRPPGKQPPSEAIITWIEAKGIATQLENEISITSLAFLIARKIAREGWQPEKTGSDIVAEVVTPQRIQQVIDRVSTPLVNEFCNDIINFLKQIAA
ncbi:hypothetical protein GCM10007424_25090 [Flavobacterium suaedae]|uniref:Uncharacterized protein n=1 Tax=Flavobacterium suaedae TaxID=1767027 RepID=A0ABQ1K4N7_9FLAO|nr:hypothetical protein [Flavobacterium suaedae]GGB84064.1 hypothetical protein GCM10007424_25090 [Flavobacterium suaedae]